MGDLIAGLPPHFLRDLRHGYKLGIEDLATPGTDDMWMWVRFIAIVMAARGSKIKLQNLAHIL